MRLTNQQKYAYNCKFVERDITGLQCDYTFKAIHERKRYEGAYPFKYDFGSFAEAEEYLLRKHFKMLRTIKSKVFSNGLVKCHLYRVFDKASDHSKGTRYWVATYQEMPKKKEKKRSLMSNNYA